MVWVFPINILKTNIVNIHKGYNEISQDYYGKQISNQYNLTEDEEVDVYLLDTEIDKNIEKELIKKKEIKKKF